MTQATALPKDTANPNQVMVLFNGMVNPLIPYGIKGAIWYQGEANAGRAYQYRTLLPTMIGDWRARWGEGNFPFYIVQLANWAPGGESWAELREAQEMNGQRTVPNAGIATAVDIGGHRQTSTRRTSRRSAAAWPSSPRRRHSGRRSRTPARSIRP